MVVAGDILSGRYLLQDELGAGGMGTVYRAVDLRTGAEVAIKVPHPFVVHDRAYIERLRREAQIAASLHSPRVALVTDFAEHEGTPYLVMEYVPGVSLATLLEREDAMRIGDALHVALEVARALDAAHQRGIVHRDLKPGNIHLDNDDVKVLDFGIARLDGQSNLTAAGTLGGSPEYIAPERMEGQADIRADIYSLGIVLYEMITGRPPFEGATPWTVLRRHAAEPPPPLPPSVPAVVAAIIERCLAKRPEARYQTPRELIGALQEAIRTVQRQQTEAVRLTSPPVPQQAAPADAVAPTLALPHGAPPAQPPAPIPPGPEPHDSASAPPTVVAPVPASGASPERPSLERRKAPWWLIPAAGAALIVVAAAAFLLVNRGGGAGQQAAGSPAAVEPPAGAAAGAAPSVAFVFPPDGAEAPSPVRVEVKTSGVTLKRPTEQDPGARHLHYFLDTDPAAVIGPGQPVPTGVQNIIHTPDTVQPLNLTPGQHTVWVVMTDNDHLPLQPGVQAKVTFTVTGTPARTGEQAPLVYQSLEEGKWRLFLMDGAGRNQRRLAPSPGNDVEPAWSPDGTKLAFASDRDGRFHLYVMNADGTGVQQLTRGDFQDRGPAWSPDGASLAFHSDRDGGVFHLFVLPAGGGDARQLTRGAGNDFSPAWSADGKQIAFARQQGQEQHIFVVDAGGGELKQLTTARRSHIDPAWSPDGRQIAFSAFENNRWNVFVMNADGSGVQRVTNGDPQDRQPAWSPDGRQIVFASGRDGQMGIYVLPLGGGQPRALTEGLAHNQHPSWPRK